MKFKNLIQEAAKKVEIEETLRDPDFNVGAEFEFILDRKKVKKDWKNVGDAFDIVNDILSQNGLKAEVKQDTSISDKNSYDFNIYDGIEIATYPTTLQQALIDFPKYLDIIKQIGYTNESTGLHVGISHKKYKTSDINPTALGQSLEDKRVYKTMPSRENAPLLPSSQGRIMAKGIYSFGKYQTMNVKKDYIEFRAMGGNDYEDKWPEIRKIILNYATKYKQAAESPETFGKRKLLAKGGYPEDRMKVFNDLIKSNQWQELMSAYMDYIREWFNPNTFPWNNDLINTLLLQYLDKIYDNKTQKEFFEVIKLIFSDDRASKIFEHFVIKNRALKDILSMAISPQIIKNFNSNTLIRIKEILEKDVSNRPYIFVLNNEIKKKQTNPQSSLGAPVSSGV